MTAEGSRTLEPLYDTNCGRKVDRCFIPRTIESVDPITKHPTVIFSTSSSGAIIGTCKHTGGTRCAVNPCNFIPKCETGNEDDDLAQLFFQRAIKKLGA